MPRALTVVCRVLCGRCVRRMLCMHRTPRPTCRPFETSRHACVPWRQLEELKVYPTYTQPKPRVTAGSCLCNLSSNHAMTVKLLVVELLVVELLFSC